MTKKQMVEIFDKSMDGNEFLRWALVDNRLSLRKDVHAFSLLDQIVPGGSDRMVAAAEHDQIWLSVDPEALALAATPEQILDLCRCGVMYDGDTDSLSMFA